VFILFQVTFSNVSLSSMQYNILFQNTFVTPHTTSEMGLNDVKIIWFLLLKKLN
jgi:hypothetical protein